jgi:ribosomal protein S18 acetylase RimI-like enzyme
MSLRAVEIVPCPPGMSVESLALVLEELTPIQRRDFAAVPPGQQVEALVVALENAEVIGAAWGQRQPGSTALFWPPRWRADVDLDASVRLACATIQALDKAGIRMTQALVSDREAEITPVFAAAGFTPLADLLYLNWEAATVEQGPPTPLQFEPYDESQRERFATLVEATYEATQDCPALGGKRPMDEVLDGYRATGNFRPENWLFVRSHGADIGVLLLAEHVAARHWELMYMGLVPAARGRSLGREVVRRAQSMARDAGAERVVLAVDAENIPAIKMYNETGFRAWDRRSVFVRFCDANSQLQESP